MPIITILFGESIITKGSKKNSPHNYSEMGLSNMPASNKANRLIRLTRDDNDNDDTEIGQGTIQRLDAENTTRLRHTGCTGQEPWISGYGRILMF